MRTGARRPDTPGRVLHSGGADRPCGRVRHIGGRSPVMQTGTRSPATRPGTTNDEHTPTAGGDTGAGRTRETDREHEPATQPGVRIGARSPEHGVRRRSSVT